MTRDISTVETLSAAVITVWGIAILNPFINSFERYPKIYAPMISIVPHEWFWGLFFAFNGILSLILFYRGYTQIAGILLIACFGSMATLFFLGDVQSHGWAIYGIIGIWNVFNFWEQRGYKWKSRKD